MVSLDYLGIGNQIREIAYEENVCTILSNKGKELTKLDYRGTSTANYTFVLRSDLIKILSETLQPNSIIFNKQLTSFKQNDEGILIYFEDGTSFHAHYMIASDGIFSTVRQQLLPDKKVRFAGYTCWRGVVESCPQYIERKYTETWGPKGRIGIIPLTNNRIYWYAFKNCQANDKELKQWKMADILFNFSDYHPPIQQIIDRTKEDRIFQKDIYDLDPIFQFTCDRILLLGDAAHATTPNMGQGALSDN